MEVFKVSIHLGAVKTGYTKKSFTTYETAKFLMPTSTDRAKSFAKKVEKDNLLDIRQDWSSDDQLSFHTYCLGHQIAHAEDLLKEVLMRRYKQKLRSVDLLTKNIKKLDDYAQ